MVVIIVPECPFCNKSDKVIQKTIWFKHKRQKHYVIVWICNRCNACLQDSWCG